MTKNMPNKPKPADHKPPLLVQLIRKRVGETPVLQFAKGAGIPYSRAHGLMHSEGEYYASTVERALTYLAPELMRRIEDELDADKPAKTRKQTKA